MFRRLAPDGDAGRVTLTVDGEAVTVPAGLSVAAALIQAGRTPMRTTPVSGAARAPYCMMGVCFDCLVEIDGTPNRQACMEEVRDGMRVAQQAGARKAPL